MNLRATWLQAASVAVLNVAFIQSASAANNPVVWEGDADLSWSNGSNWVGDFPPPVDDHAKFTGTFFNQPTLVQATEVGGVWITGLNQDLGAVPNSNILTLNGNTVDGIPNIAVLFNDSTGFNATIGNQVSIANTDLVVRNDTDNNLAFSAPGTSITVPLINLNSNYLILSANGAGTITTGNIGGAGGITIDSSGTGAVITNSNNTHFAGQLTVLRGILQTNSVNNDSANGKLGNSALSVILGSNGNTGTLLFNGGTNNVTGNANQGGSKRFTLADGGIGRFDLTPAADSTLTLTGVIDGNGAMEIEGDGSDTLQLSGASTYTGGTTLTSGTLSIGSSSDEFFTSGPVGTGTLTFAGGTLTSSGTRSIVNPIVIDGITNIRGGGSLTLTGSISSTNESDEINLTGGAVALDGDLGNYAGKINWDRSNSGSLNFNSLDINLSQASLVMNGSTEASGSMVRVGISGSEGAGPVTVRFGELSGTGGVINPQTSGSSQTYEIGFLDTDATFGGIFHGRTNRPGNLTKVGTGSLTLTGANYYFGGTNTVSAGTLIAGADVISSTTMDGTNTSLTITSDVFTQLGHGLEDGDRIAFTTGSGDLDTVTQWYVVNSTADTFQVSATENGSPLTGITDAVEGVTTGVQAGAFGGGANAIVLGDFQTKTGNPLTATPNVADNSVAVLTGGAFTVERAITVTNTFSTGTATIGGNTDSNSEFSGPIDLQRNAQISQVATSGENTLTVSGVISGFGVGITKVGAGRATLTADNTYTGDTVVSEGTLLVNGNHAGGGSYTVEAGGTLGGSGYISAAVDLSGTISPGASTPGTLTVGGLTLQDGSTAAFQLDPTNTTVGSGINDLIDIDGALTAFDATTININVEAVGGGDLTAAGDWTLATYNSLAGTGLPTFNVTGIGSGFSSTVNVGLGSVLLSVLATGGIDGDYNEDGFVNAADYVLWRDRLGSGTALPNDDGLGTPVGNGQYALWKANFGASSGSGVGLGSTAIPEPATLALFAMALAGLALHSRRKNGLPV